MLGTNQPTKVEVRSKDFQFQLFWFPIMRAIEHFNAYEG